MTTMKRPKRPDLPLRDQAPLGYRPAKVDIKAGDKVRLTAEGENYVADIALKRELRNIRLKGVYVVRGIENWLVKIKHPRCPELSIPASILRFAPGGCVDTPLVYMVERPDAATPETPKLKPRGLTKRQRARFPKYF